MRVPLIRKPRMGGATGSHLPSLPGLLRFFTVPPALKRWSMICRPLSDAEAGGELTASTSKKGPP